MKVVKFDNEAVSCTCDDQVCTESLINSNAGTLDLTGSGMKRGRRRHRRRQGTRFFESEDLVRIDLSGDTGSHVEKMKNCCPESKTPTHWKRRSPTVHLNGRWWEVGGGRTSTLGCM